MQYRIVERNRIETVYGRAALYQYIKAGATILIGITVFIIGVPIAIYLVVLFYSGQF